MKVVHEETMCCGFKKCPTVRVFEDGSVELRDDEEGATPVKMRPEVAKRLVEILLESKV